ncbi:MAG: pentapeptide repeat-containing protein [Asgard group archaeon]
MTKCTYKNDELRYECDRQAYPNSPHNLCILHEEMKNKDPEETRQAFYKEIEDGETNFTGCKLPPIDLSHKTIKEVNFRSAKIRGDARFEGATIGRDVWFYRAKIEGIAVFDIATIGLLN